MSKIKDLETLKTQMERAKQNRDRAQGALDSAMKQLREEFEVESLEDAEKLLNQLEKEEEKAKNKFDKALARFEEKWGDELS